MSKVHFFTLGCRLNQSETAVLEGVFRARGFQVVGKNDPADIVVINTCTVTAEGDSDARKLAARVHREQPQASIAVIGCQAQVQKEKLLSWPGVRWVVGTAKKMELCDFVQKDFSQKTAMVIPPISRKPFSLPISSAVSSRTRANLKIQDGCDNFCAYCEIPYARGRARSREFENILDEAAALVNLGHKEIVLTGINVGLYQHKNKNLMDVVKALHDLSGLERIRISSIEHTTLPLKLAEFMVPQGKLCRFLHIPVQSGSADILEKMGRRYTVKEFFKLTHSLRRRVPGLMIGTDVIVGFPGETDRHFEETRLFLERSSVNYCHVFSYSHRYRARSRTFKGAIAADVIKKRSEILRNLSLQKKRIFLESLIGSRGGVLIEEKKGDYWVGHTDNYVKIKVFSKRNLKNKMVSVRLHKIDGEAILGTVLE
ncbi:MAG: tRNA (N(6)-L-threonylcarbamoyladenosine(37)-C(2))-methylthiotransferase MtaB [Candidatus Omnitrophica bacterium]|nr:tRNA (N(6)-L-threonylcarbamoyladenosine(37)-C(2))-methylthiotransferase MtaB [Candidatus Omnitrophota bacterium]